MTRTRFFILAGLVLGSPAVARAQSGQAPANIVTPAPAPREGTVGPEQLRDFALPGTRQGQAAPSAEVPRPEPAVRSAGPAPAGPQPTAGPAPRPSPQAATDRDEPASPAARQSGADQQPSEVPPPPATVAVAAPLAMPPAAEPVPPIVVTEPSTASGLLPGWWPWLLAAGLAGIALALTLRQRRRLVPAGPDADTFNRAAPQPPPLSLPPRVPPEPAVERSPAPALDPELSRPLPAGLVTTRLRPLPPPALAPAPAPLPAGAVVSRRLRGWIELDLVVREVLLDATEALFRVDLIVANSGTSAAREIAVEALTINAGENQGAELVSFFERPAAASAAIPELGPLSDTVLSHELRMPRSAIRAYEAQGRTLFVPVLAFTAVYRTASGEGRTSAAFLVGREVPGSPRLAPLRLAGGAERLRGLGQRRLDEAVRR